MTTEKPPEDPPPEVLETFGIETLTIEYHADEKSEKTAENKDPRRHTSQVQTTFPRTDKFRGHPSTDDCTGGNTDEPPEKPRRTNYTS